MATPPREIFSMSSVLMSGDGGVVVHELLFVAAVLLEIRAAAQHDVVKNDERVATAARRRNLVEVAMLVLLLRFIMALRFDR